MSGGSEARFSGFHDGLRQCRVGVDGFSQITGHCGRFDRDHAFANQLAGSWACDTNAKDALSFRIEQNFGQPICPVQCASAS